MEQGLFRKEALARFMRVDAPGAIIAVTPPSAVVLFGTMAALFAALLVLILHGRAQLVAEGRGVIRPDIPPVQVPAPFTGTVLAVRRGPRDVGRAGDMLIELDVRAERASHESCASVVAEERHELTSLEQRLSDWDQAKDPSGGDHDAAMALVLITQIRAQREKVIAESQKCEALGSLVERARITFPVDATVTDVAVAAGAHVRDGETLATLAPSGSRLVGYVQIPERYRSEVKVGQAVSLKFDAFPYDDFGVGSGRVTRLLDDLPSSVKIDGAEAGVPVELAINAMPAGASPPRPGMTFSGGVLTRRTRIASLLFGGSSDDE